MRRFLVVTLLSTTACATIAGFGDRPLDLFLVCHVGPQYHGLIAQGFASRGVLLLVPPGDRDPGTRTLQAARDRQPDTTVAAGPGRSGPPG